MAESKNKSTWPIGQLVRSKTGRDQGRYYLVCGISPKESYLLLVDGEKRTVDSPKRKNMQHVQVVDKIYSELADKIRQGRPVDNLEIRRMLKELGADKTNQETLKEVGK